MGIFPIIAQAYARFDFVHVLSAGTAASEGVPMYLAFIDRDFEWFGLREHGHGGGRGMYPPLCFGRRDSLDAIHS